MEPLLTMTIVCISRYLGNTKFEFFHNIKMGDTITLSYDLNGKYARSSPMIKWKNHRSGEQHYATSRTTKSRLKNLIYELDTKNN